MPHRDLHAQGFDTTDRGERRAFNTMVYTDAEVERIAVNAFELAMKRDRKLCSVDKANVLEVSQLWREVPPPPHPPRARCYTLLSAASGCSIGFVPGVLPLSCQC